MIVLVKIQIAREIFVKFLYVQYLFSNVVSDHEGTEQGGGGGGGGGGVGVWSVAGGGNMKKKCARLIFMEGEKSGGTFNRTGDF